MEQQLLKWKAHPATKLPPLPPHTRTPVYTPPHVPLRCARYEAAPSSGYLPTISSPSPHISQVRSVTNLRSRRNVLLIALAAARRALLCVPPAPRVIGLGLGYAFGLSLSPSLSLALR